MNLDNVEVYNLRMCMKDDNPSMKDDNPSMKDDNPSMKDDNPCLKYFNGDTYLV